MLLAERIPGRATRAAQRELRSLPPAPTAARAWAEYALGWALLCWERLADARKHLEAAAVAFAAERDTLAGLRCEYALLLLGFSESAQLELVPAFLALAERLEQHAAPGEAFQARLQAALLLDTQGNASKAEAILAALEPALESVPPLVRARWCYARGAVAGSRSDFPAAEALLAQAQRQFVRMRAAVDQGKCWFQRAWVALQHEQVNIARDRYHQAEQIFNRLDLPLRRAFCNRGMGLLYTRIGAYDEALQRQLAALSAFTALARTVDTGICQLNLGNIYLYAGWWDLAQAHYTRALELFDRAGSVGWRIKAQRNRALAYTRQGQHAKAEPLLHEVIDHARHDHDRGLMAEALTSLAELLAERGVYEAAITRFEQARRLYLAIDAPLGQADSAMGQAWLMLEHGQRAEAEALFGFAAPLVEHHPYNHWRVQHGLARCAELRGDPATALVHYRTASTIVAGLRGRLAHEAASSTLFEQAAHLHADSLRCAASAGVLADLLEFGELQRALVLQGALTSHPLESPATHRAELDLLQAQIAALQDSGPPADDSQAQALDDALARYAERLLYARASARPASQPDTVLPRLSFNLGQLRSQLNAAYQSDWSALVYMRSDDMLLLVAISPDQLVLERIADDPALQYMIERAALPKFQIYTYRDLPYLRGNSSQRWAIPSALAELLIPAHVRARLHPQHHLLIVPLGQLHALPWAALRLDNQWLAERAIIQLVPALTVWQGPAAQPDPGSVQALLIGCRKFGNRAPALPAVAAELAMVSALWPGTYRRLEDEQATRAALLEISASGELARYRVVHVATHAQLVPMRGVTAHLKLWDQDLWLAEVASLRLGGALVVLSACDGAGTHALPGDEVLSLSWALLAAGAAGVLASLWPVNDQAAREFMELFYTALCNHGDAGRALAEAQRQMIAGTPGAAAAEPWLWGSFVLIGTRP
ncbi:MAG: CHAT domain-containing protein [Kouleothrix sp.]|nr:CHAT domain-containing protein [Kouleothrix sp.]